MQHSSRLQRLSIMHKVPKLEGLHRLGSGIVFRRSENFSLPIYSYLLSGPNHGVAQTEGPICRMWRSLATISRITAICNGGMNAM